MGEFVLADAPQNDYEAIPENEVLTAEVIVAEDRDSIWDLDKTDPSKGKQREVSFRFQITQPGDWEGRTVFGSTPTTFSNHPDCKLRVWVQEILGQDTLPTGFKFNTESLTGLPVKVVIGNYFKTNADGTKTAKDKVVDLIRVGGFADAADTF